MYDQSPTWHAADNSSGSRSNCKQVTLLETLGATDPCAANFIGRCTRGGHKLALTLNSTARKQGAGRN